MIIINSVSQRLLTYWHWVSTLTYKYKYAWRLFKTTLKNAQWFIFREDVAPFKFIAGDKFSLRFLLQRRFILWNDCCAMATALLSTEHNFAVMYAYAIDLL